MCLECAPSAQTSIRLAQISPFKLPAAVLQVPKRAYTLEELRLNKIEPIKFLAPEDKTLNRVRTILQVIPHFM